MKKVTVNIPAKLNLTLDVSGAENGYHTLNSLVTSITLYDTITVKKRKDNKIRIIERGIKCGCSKEDNNAYKTAKLFMQEFGCLGVDITIKKRIPIGNGLGGSSADIAGVLKGMQRLYNIDANLTPLAEKLGSDTAYMLKGGFMVMSGRGETLTPLEVDKKLYILLVSSNNNISAGECFREFDRQNLISKTCTNKAVTLLTGGKVIEFCNVIKNDLYLPALKFVKGLEHTILDLEISGAKTALMTGSGSCCYGIFLNKKDMNIAYKRLKSKYKKFLIKTETVN